MGKPRIIQDHLVYAALSEDFYMDKSEISEKSGVPFNNISGCMTRLRRKGLTSHIGNRNQDGGFKYIKHTYENPLIPPQGDDANQTTEEQLLAIKKMENAEKGIFEPLPKADPAIVKMSDNEPHVAFPGLQVSATTLPAEGVQGLLDRTPEEILEDMLTLLTELSEAVKKAPVAMTIPDHLDAIHRLRDNPEP